MSRKKVGKIIIPSNANVMAHEMSTAKALSSLGMEVEFIRKSTRERETSANIYLDGVKWEIKSPISAKLSSIEKNLKKASKRAIRSSLTLVG